MNKHTIILSVCSIFACLSLHGMDEIASKDAKEKPLEIKRFSAELLPQKSNAQDSLEQEDGDLQLLAQPQPQRSPEFTKNTQLHNQIQAHVAWVLQKPEHYEQSVLKKDIESDDRASLQTLLFSYFDEIHPLINLLLQHKDYQYYKALIYVMRSVYKQTKNPDFSACATNIIRVGLNYAFKHDDKKLFNAILNDYFVLAYPVIQNLINRKKFDVLAQVINFGFDITQRPISNALSILEKDPRKRNYSLCRLALETSNIEALVFLFKQQPEKINIMIANMIKEQGFLLDTVDIERLYDAINQVNPQSEILKQLLQLDQQLQKQLHAFLENITKELTQEELYLLKIETFTKDHKLAIVDVAKRIDKKTQRIDKKAQKSDKRLFLVNIYYSLGILLYETLTNNYVVFSQTAQLPESTASTFAASIILHTTTITSSQETTHSRQLSLSPSVNEPSSPSSSTSSPLSFSVSPILSPTLSPELRPLLALRGNREIPSIAGVFSTMAMRSFARQMAAESKL